MLLSESATQKKGFSSAMEFKANADKKVDIVSEGVLYKRHAIQTHFVQIGVD